MNHEEAANFMDENYDDRAIAIIGMVGRFPGANNLEQFWHNLKNGVETISFLSKEELIQIGVEAELINNHNYVKAHAGISDIDKFDADFFGLSPREAREIDPQQRIFLECAWELIESSGYNPNTYDGAIGVYAGASLPTYLLSNVWAQHSVVKNTRSFEQMLANDRDYLATRVAYKLNLTGPAVTVQTACSTSLVAVHMACQSLINGECDMAMAGGISIIIPQEGGYLYQEGMVQSPDGHCRTFDARAQGTIFGNGVGIVLLKGLPDAIADGDYIYGAISGSAINNDGAFKLGYTAPSVAGQTAVISEAQAVAGVDPETISYIEAHGTATPLGDPIEVEALTKAFAKHTEKKQFCALGSVKSNMGHLNSAAGVAGLIKTVLALKHKLIPPSLHFEQPNRQIDFANSPFYVNTTLSEWHDNGKPRRAGVSSFGVGGTNAHVILEEAPPLVNREEEDKGSVYLLTLSAKTPQALAAYVANYYEHLQNHPQQALADICYTANTGRVNFEHKLAVTASSKEELVAKLLQRQNGEEVVGLCSGRSSSRTKVAFLFAGQGGQYINMGRQLYETQPTFRDSIDQCDRIGRPYLAKPLLEVLYPEISRKVCLTTNQQLLDQTAYTQPALFAIEYALARLWQSWGIEPDVVMGHSVGEYVAATIAGVFSLEDALKLIAARARLMQQLPAGGEMVSVMASEAKVRSLIPPHSEKVAIAAINGPQSVVISGEELAVRAIVTQLESEGIETKRLQVSHAFHSPLMKPMLAEFAVVARQIAYKPPQITLISNVTGEQVDREIAEADYWIEHVSQPVNFVQGMKTLHDRGLEVFLEIGPKAILLAMGRQCLPAETGVWLPSLRPGIDAWQQMLSSLGQLYVLGVPIDWSGYYREYRGQKLPLPTYPFQRQSYWIERTIVSPSVGSQTDFTASVGSKHFSEDLSLIGQKLPLPFTGQVRFQTQLTPDFPSYVKDHRYYGRIVVAGASHIVMALLAGQELLKSKSCIVENIEFLQILGVDETGDRAIQLILDPENEKEYAYQLVSCLTGAELESSSAWKLHAQAKVRSPRESELKSKGLTIDIEAVQKRCGRVLSSSEYYSEILAPLQGEFVLGPTFQWTDRAWLGETEGLIALKSVAKEAKMQEYVPHPGAIDAGLILIARMLFKDGEITTAEGQYAFSGAEKFSFLEAIDPYEKLWYYTNIDESNSHVGDDLRGDCYLLSSTGRVLAEFTGVYFRRLSRKLLLKSEGLDLSQWYYQLQWQADGRSIGGDNLSIAETGTYLLFLPASAEELSAELSSQGHRCIVVYPATHYQQLDERHYQLCPTNPEHFRNLLQAIAPHAANRETLPWKGIVHLWSLDSNLQDLVKAQELTCASILHLLQGMRSAFKNAWPPLWLVTKGAQRGLKDDGIIVAPQQALLWGLGRVISLEYPDLNCRCLDLDAQASAEQGFKHLLSELLSPDAENQICYRQGQRQVARLLPTQLETTTELAIATDSSYLITGGNGALGLEMARWLVGRGAKYIVLTGRSQPSETATEQIQQLETAGANISVLLGDISNWQDVAEIFQQIRASLPPLSGIIHAAGVLDDGVMEQMSWEQFIKVLAPKVAGTWYLHEFSQELPLDFFVCFSSMASLLGSPGQGNYAAANAFMDAIAHYRRAMGLPGLSINWGPWARGGMAAKLAETRQNRLASLGLQKIQFTQGLQALEEALNSKQAQIAVFPVNWQQFFTQYTGIPAFLSEIASQFIPQDGSTGPKLFLERLLLETTEQRQQMLIDYLIRTVAQVLGRGMKDLPDPEAGFFNLGMDSLVALELSQKIQADLGLSLGSTVTFEYPNVRELALYLEEIIPQSLSRGPDETPKTDIIAESETPVEDRIFAEVSELSEEEMEQSVDEALAQLSKLL